MPAPPLTCDIAIIGGGLGGGLIALALAEKRPELDVRLIDAGAVLGGNHLWSFFDSNIAPEDRWLIEPLICHRWDHYDIMFPAHERTFDAAYNSIESRAFDKVLRARIAAEKIIKARVTSLGRDTVTFDDGTTLSARHVIDARGPGDLSTLEVGWQKFVGEALTISGGHGLTRPIVMDATVDQIDGYRFVYCLPFDAETVFIEDTYYSDSPDLDVETVRNRIADYAAAHSWQIAARGHKEAGVLPVVVSGDFDRYWNSSGADTAKAGLRAGMFHPTTGYSLPDAVRLATAMPALVDLDGPAFVRAVKAMARETWKRGGFYRTLDTMLFHAADPDDRYKVLERFYRLSPALISRFYSGTTTIGDKIRVLSGKPPVSIWRAYRALLGARNGERKL
ncbi:MAG: lycopene beta-cyclase CrtY [Sphingomonadaceae bacterium]